MALKSRKRSNPEKKVSPFEKKENKILIGVVIVLAIILAVVLVWQGFGGNSPEENPTVLIKTSMGDITVELYSDLAPNTVDNFLSYVDDGFYEDLVFHRVANLDPSAPQNHIIQGGGFYADGTRKDTNDPIDLEINDEALHIDGAIAMARTSDPNSATSQFYICDGPQEFLDENYAVFGITVEGIDVVRAISEVSTTTKNSMSNWPVEDVIIEEIIRIS